MKPWDLERLSAHEVERRLAWIKHQLKQAEDERRQIEAEVNSLG